MVNLQLTDEEASELVRTLVGRIDLDISNNIKKSVRVDKYGKVLSVDEASIQSLMHLKQVNQSILNKLFDMGITY